jgi:hemerythrin superfamily protein
MNVATLRASKKGCTAMNATELLKEQHDEVKDLFEQFEASEEQAEQREIFIQIADALSAHATIEEKIFYPSVKVKDTEDLLREALEEHLAAKRVIADLLELDASDETFEPKVKVLQEQIEHHVEEEEGELFAKVRKLFTKEELEVMGSEMERMFEELMAGEPREEVPAQTEAAPPLE